MPMPLFKIIMFVAAAYAKTNIISRACEMNWQLAAAVQYAALGLWYSCASGQVFSRHSAGYSMRVARYKLK